ncbi:hypothetical protein XX58_000750 [Salmonella enterica subsp. salamae]|uniref:NERD domain-containing protein n=2 Tax=Salmonella enterica TaxID=28901 RepID=A0A603KRW5_SALER|nr:hypothetical protein [Salmonella enterica subsp. salamae]EAM3921208.1 hypothetical protein [Salmonella enterica]EBP3807286.1 hypothetical protein [Salmonella enterica subsp. enterica]EDX4957680.1 hypothetical protein [Salmonella enterica subsp. salamae serovar 58:l,z13,z28:z6]EAN9128970.1 hypothetical protein [Salmonella enterica]
MTPIEEHLYYHGPCLSTDLAKHLVDHLGITYDAARKQVSRAEGDVGRLNFNFPHRARFLYHKKDFASERYWTTLVNVMQDTNSSYGMALSSLIARGGIIPKKHFTIASGSPIAMKGRLSCEQVLKKLIELKLVEIVNLPSYGECITLIEKDERYFKAMGYIKARLTGEDILLNTIVQWAKNLGFTSYDMIQCRNDDKELPRVANFNWDISGPSYLSPLVTNSGVENTKPGFFICDVLLGSKITLLEIKPFINKCTSLRSLPKVGKSLFMFVAEDYTHEAFKALKSIGIIPATPETLFGKEFSEGIRKLIEFMEFIAGGGEVSLEHIDNVITNLAPIEGALSTLRGVFFEYLVAEVFRSSGNGTVTIGKVYKTQEKTAEADVTIQNGYKEIKFIECKGYSPYSQIPDDIVTRWLHHQVPTFFKWVRENISQDIDIICELWTTGKLSQESIAALDSLSKKISPKKYTIKYREAHDVIMKFKETKDKSLLNTFEEHFVKNRYSPKNKPYIARSVRYSKKGPNH